MVNVWNTIVSELNKNPALLFAIGGFLAGLVVIGIGILWGSIHGKYITNVSLALEMMRTTTSDQNKHDLITIIKIEKEPVNALTLETMKVELFRITDDDLEEEIRRWRELLPLSSSERRPDDIWTPQRKAKNGDLNRSLNCAGKLCTERRILAFWTPEIGRAENLAPLEKTQFASYSRITSTDVYEVVVTVIGIRYTSYPAKLFWSAITLGLWRSTKAYYAASTITVPADVVCARQSDT